MSRIVTGAYFKGLRRQDVAISDATLEDCSFDSCSLRNARIFSVHARSCRAWACNLHQPVIEHCTIDGLSLTLRGGGGRRSPMIVFGGLYKHVMVRGTVGALILNPPFRWLRGNLWLENELQSYREYYAGVDWALDISEARFTSVPSLRFAAPGGLIRRDPLTQALVRRRDLEKRSPDSLPGFRVWKTQLEELLRRPWPEETILAAATAGGNLDQQLEGLASLRQAGIAS